MPTDPRVHVRITVHRPRCLAMVRRGQYVGLCDADLDEHGQCPTAALHKPTTSRRFCRLPACGCDGYEHEM